MLFGVGSGARSAPKSESTPHIATHCIDELIVCPTRGVVGSRLGVKSQADSQSKRSFARRDLCLGYLRTVPAQAGQVNIGPAPRAQDPQDELGRDVFEGGCANCHQYSGDGRQTDYASLAGSRSVNDPGGADLTQSC
jgi:hypothetical protein